MKNLHFFISDIILYYLDYYIILYYITSNVTKCLSENLEVEQNMSLPLGYLNIII